MATNPSFHADNSLRSLRDDLPRIKLHEHGSICLEIFYRHGETKIVKKKKLKL